MVELAPNEPAEGGAEDDAPESEADVGEDDGGAGVIVHGEVPPGGWARYTPAQ